MTKLRRLDYVKNPPETSEVFPERLVNKLAKIPHVLDKFNNSSPPKFIQLNVEDMGPQLFVLAPNTNYYQIYCLKLYYTMICFATQREFTFIKKKPKKLLQRNP